MVSLEILNFDSFSLDNCFDGIKNQNEDDRDCGGICDTCQEGKNTIS